MAKMPVTTEADPPVETGLTAGSSGPEIEVVSQEDDAVAELQKQIAALKQSESMAKQRAAQAELDRQQALQRATERDAQVASLQQKSEQSQLDIIGSALVAAKAEAASAEQDFRAAVNESNIEAQVEANTRLSKAHNAIARLEDGKADVEAKLAEQKEQIERQKAQPQQQGDQLDRTNLPDMAKTWLRSHPDYLTDQRKNAKIQSLHWDVVDEGHAPFSQGYFESLETHLGLRQAEGGEDQQQRTSAAMVSAPVSRQTTSRSNPKPSNGKITLTQEQKEYAKIAGVSEVDYAKGLIQLQEAKANGRYGGAP